jgi:hypothetical protein
MDTFTFPVKQNVHCIFTPQEAHKLIDCLLVIANDADGIRPDQDFADTMATALIRQLRELGLPLS